jgi:hypothetical protein
VADVEHRDARQKEAVRDGDQGVVEVRVRKCAEGDDRQVRDPGDRAPQRCFARGRYFVCGDFFWPFSSYS